MSAESCLIAKIQAGVVDTKKSEEALKLLRRRTALARGDENIGAKEAVEILQKQTRDVKRRKFLQMQRWRQIADGQVDLSARDLERYYRAVISFDPRGRFNTASVDDATEQVRSTAFGLMSQFIEENRSRAAGLQFEGRDKASIHAIRRELKGENTGDAAAKEQAAGISQMLEYMRREFNLSGGSIPFRKDFGYPQIHIARRVAQAGRDQWRRDIIDLLDREQMIDLETGKPMTDAKLSEVLNRTYDKIVTDGDIDIVPGQGGIVARSIGTKRAEERYLIFRDADALQKYEDLYGEQNLFVALVNHVDGMSRDIGVMRILGPNPEATIRQMKQTIAATKAREATAAGRPLSNAEFDALHNKASALDREYATVSGAIYSGDGNKWTRGIQGARQIINSSLLGSTTLIATGGDLATSAVTAAFLGMPVSRVVMRQLRTFATNSVVDRRVALRGELGAEGWAATALTQSRYTGELLGPNATRRISDVVLRSSLLNAWTDGARVGFKTEYAGHIAEAASSPWASLPSPTRNSLARHGITPGEWDTIRRTPKFEAENGATLIRPSDIIANNTKLAPDAIRALATKFHGLIRNETDFAIPIPSVRSQAFLSGGFKRGTFWGEAIGIATMLKQFPTTLAMTHLNRGFNDVYLSTGGRYAYVAGLFVAMTMAGALAFQLRSIAKGRDPVDMTDPKVAGTFWANSMLTGGGLGIFGDFLFQDFNRFGGSLAETLLGPGFSALGRATAIGQIAIQATFDEKARDKLGPRLLEFSRSFMPGQNLWYARLAFERMALDNIREQIDPDYKRKIRGMKRRARREFGQDFFAPPGRSIQRPPDLAAAFGG